RSEKGLFEASRKRAERWSKIARESSQQARRVRVPQIADAIRLPAALQLEAAHRYFLEEASAPPLLHEIPEERHDIVAILVGPEGGWTEAERSLAHAAGWTGVSLGPQILRAETAASAALAVVVAAWAA